MKEHIEKKYIINERILSLKNLLTITEQNASYLNVLVSERIAARDDEIKKKKTIEENIGKLEAVLKELTEI